MAKSYIEYNNQQKSSSLVLLSSDVYNTKNNNKNKNLINIFSNSNKNNNNNNNNEKKETVVWFGKRNDSNNIEIELIPLKNKESSFPLTSSQQCNTNYDDSNLSLYENLTINREKINKRKFFCENLSKLMRNNFAIIFLFFLCGLPLLIKISPVMTLKKIDNTTLSTKLTTFATIANKLQQNKRPIIKHLKTNNNYNSTILTTITTQSTTKIDIKLNIILDKLKSETKIKTLQNKGYRMKTLCSRAFVSVRNNSVVAKIKDENKAFSSEQTLIQVLRLGDYVALRNDYLNLFICYDETGHLRPTKLENISDLCIFQIKTIFNQIQPYKELISVSNRFTDSTIQFRNDGYDNKAQLSLPLNKITLNNESIYQYTNILYNTKSCPQYTGLLLFPSQLDDINIAEKQVDDNIINIQEEKLKFMNENKDFLIEYKKKLLAKSSTTTSTTTTTTTTTTKTKTTPTTKKTNIIIFYPNNNNKKNLYQ